MTCPDCGRAMQRVTVAERRVYACGECSVAWIPEGNRLVRLPPAPDAVEPRAETPEKPPSLVDEFIEQVVEYLLDR